MHRANPLKGKLVSELLKICIAAPIVISHMKKYDAFNNLIERKISTFIDIKVLPRVKTNDVCKCVEKE